MREERARRRDGETAIHRFTGSPTLRLYTATVLCILCASALNAATYYVATNGNNGAAGSIGAPWATIRYGLSAMAGGDTLNLRGGTYSDDGFIIAEIKSGPATNQPTVIQSYPGEWATYFPTLGNTNTQSGPGAHGFLIDSGKSNIVLNGFEINALNCWADAIKLDGAGIAYITLTNLIVRNSALGHGLLTSGNGANLYGLITHCRFITNGWNATEGGPFHQLYLKHSALTVENCYIQGGLQAQGFEGWGIHFYVSGGTNAVFRNNFITNCPNGGIGIVGSSSSDVLIYNNIVYSDSGYGIDIRNGTNVSVLNNTLIGNPVQIRALNSTSVWIENNIGVAGGWGIQSHGSGTVFIRNNLVYGSSLADLDIYGSITTNANLFNIIKIEGVKTTNAVVYDAKFVSAATGNVRLLVGSSASEVGRTQTLFTTDYDGITRSGLWDIGAFNLAAAGRTLNVTTLNVGGGGP